MTVGGRQSKAMADQLATVSKLHLIDREGSLSASGKRGVERAIQIQLGLLDRAR